MPSSSASSEAFAAALDCRSDTVKMGRPPRVEPASWAASSTVLAWAAINPLPWVYTVWRLIQSRWFSLSEFGSISRAATTKSRSSPSTS